MTPWMVIYDSSNYDGFLSMVASVCVSEREREREGERDRGREREGERDRESS